MTREEFIDNITYWYELIVFCNDLDCDICSEVYDNDQRNAYIDNELVDLARNNSWEEMRDILNGYDTGYEYWSRDDYGEWEGLSDVDFDEYKNDVLEWADNQGDVWDEEEADDDEETTTWNVDEEPIRNIQPELRPEPEEETTAEDDGISFSELFLSCGNTLHEIYDNQAKEAAQEDADFSKFIAEPVSV